MMRVDPRTSTHRAVGDSELGRVDVGRVDVDAMVGAEQREVEDRWPDDPPTGAPRRTANERRTFVVDTSVLLADPHALERFEEHDVVVPLVVISELEAKRHHPE